LIALTRRTLATGVAVSLLALAMASASAQELTLRVFLGGQQRPDVFEALLDRFEEQNPGLKVEAEVGGATSEAQQQYLSTVLTSRDSAIDLMLIDVVRPAQYAAAGWAEPLDGFMSPEEKQQLLADYLPVYAEANQMGGKLVALPSFADAMFLYYRKDLLEAHGIEPPGTWPDLFSAVRSIREVEGKPDLQGLSVQGAPIEGTNCTFLVPYWSLGGEVLDADGRVAIDDAKAEKALQLWLDAKAEGVLPENVAEVRTDDTRLAFQGGNALFANLWSYGWAHFQGDQSRVAGQVGVVPLPAVEGGQPATCIGGWQWAISAFSAHKPEAYRLLRFLTSAEAGKYQAVEAAHLPVRASLYEDAEVLAANPWFRDALAVVQTARSRPVSPRYPEISDVIRSNVNAVMAGIKTPADAVAEMKSRLARILR
jgi:multiple sugar transport system substrate-binding protein